MKPKTHILFRFLTLAVAILLLLCSCESTKTNEKTSELFDWSDYVVVVPAQGLPVVSEAFGHKRVYMEEVLDALAQVTGEQPKYFSGDTPRAEHEIIIGNTVREESEALRKQYHEKDYFVTYRDGNFVVWGGSNESLCTAIAAFINKLPTIPADIQEGDIVSHTEPFIPVFINGRDVKMYYFACVDPLPVIDFRNNFFTKFGYSTRRGGVVTYKTSDEVYQRSPFIIFGRGDGFLEDMPEVEPGTAAILFNGASLMIYSATEGDTDLYKYLFQLFDEAPVVDGKIMLELKEGVTFVTLK